MITAAEGRTEISGMIVAAAMGDLPNGIIVAFHEFHGHLHAVLGEEIKNGLPIEGLKAGFQFEFIDACRLCEAGNGVMITQVLENGFAHKGQSLNIGIRKLNLHSKRFNDEWITWCQGIEGWETFTSRIGLMISIA